MAERERTTEIPHRKGVRRWKRSPRNDFSRQHRFDAFCKAVLRNEAKDYLRGVGDGSVTVKKSLEALTQQELNKLSTVDQYPSGQLHFFRRMDMIC